MNTRENLRGRLEEIQRSAAALPDHEADVSDLFYKLARLSSWVTRTQNFISTMESCQGCQDCQCEKQQAALPYK